MKAIELNLAGRPYRNDTPIAIALAVLAVAAVAFSAYNAYSYTTAGAREEALVRALSDHRARMDEIREEAASLKATLDTVDVQLLESQASFVAAVLRERNFSWTRLFNELETVVPWNIRLSSIRPAFSAGRVQIDVIGTAQDVKAFFDFQEIMEASPSFSGVLPTQYEVDESSKQVTFNLQATYLPESSEAGQDGAPGAQKASLPLAADPPAEVIVVDEGAADAAPPADEPARPRRRGRRATAGGAQAGQAGQAEPLAAEDAPAAGRTGGGAAGAGSGARPEPRTAREGGAPAGRESAGRIVGGGDAPAARGADAAAVQRTPAASSQPFGSQKIDPENPINPTEVEYDDQGRLKRIVPRVNPDRRGQQPIRELPPPPDEDAGGEESGGDEGDAGGSGGDGGAA